MKIISFLIAILISGVNPLSAQDAQVVLHESMFNKFLAAVGQISGGGKFKKAFIKTNYTWKIKNARIDLEPNNAVFHADADIKVKGITFTEKVKGSVDVKYDQLRNVISVKVREAMFDVNIFGVKVATIDLGRYYKPKFEFAGPQPIQKFVMIDLPDGKKKKIEITTTSRNFKIYKDKIIVVSTLSFKG